MKLLHTDRKRLQAHLSVLVLHLYLTHSCRGQSQLIGSSQPIVATLGDDIILPCHLKPEEDASGLTLEWTRPDLDPRFVLVWRSGQELLSKKNKLFEGRTSLFIDELNVGNISLKLNKVRLSDQGRYRCFIPAKGIESFVQLFVASDVVSSPVVTLAGIEKATGGVMLDCKSEGWYPEPEVFWLDSEGHVLSAEPTETVRGPDGLYTVSSRVTVEKRHNNNFTCRVQQKDTRQIRETQIYLPDVFFEVNSSSSLTVGLAVGLAVSLAVCILLIVVLVSFVCRHKKSKAEKSGTGKGEEIYLKTNKPKDQSPAEEPEKQQFLTEKVKLSEQTGTKTTCPSKKKSKQLQKEEQVQGEQSSKEEAENRVKTMKQELVNKEEKVVNKQAELHEEEQRMEEELQDLMEQLGIKFKEPERTTTTHLSLISSGSIRDGRLYEFDAKIRQVQQLQNKIQEMEENLQILIEDLRSSSKELKRSQAAPVQSTSSQFKWPLVSRQKLLDEQQRREEAEDKVQDLEDKVETLEEKLQTKTRELLQEKQRRWRALTELNTLKIHSWIEVDKLNTQVKELKEEKQRIDNKRQQLEKEKHELEKKLQEEIKKMEKVKTLKTEPRSSQRDETGSASSNLTTGPVIEVEVDRLDRYVRLKNTSKKNQQLRGWTLKMCINNKNPVIHTFGESLNLSPNKTFTIRGTRLYSTDLEREDLQTWRYGDKLEVVLISNTGEVQHHSVH